MDIPMPQCRHGLEAYKDEEIGALDPNHIFCDCGGVVCLLIQMPIEGLGSARIGWCDKCYKRTRILKRDYPEMF